MKILISGSSGLIGTALIEHLSDQGNDVCSLVRDKSAIGSTRIFWDPERQETEKERLEGFDAVIHLAGENLTHGRWTEETKKKIWTSRVRGTSFLTETILSLSCPPQVFVSASAVGYYGNRGNEELDENSWSGKGFLAELCRAWEEAAEPVGSRGTKLILARLGVVLDARGGMLKQMLRPFRLGVGGKLGSGSQYMSWITLDDAVRALSFCLFSSLSGAVNIVAPEPVTNLEFTRKLGWLLLRPTFFAIPRVVLSLALGEIADEMLLSSTRAYPEKLVSSAFSFHHPNIDLALRHCLATRPNCLLR